MASDDGQCASGLDDVAPSFTFDRNQQLAEQNPVTASASSATGQRYASQGQVIVQNQEQAERGALGESCVSYLNSGGESHGEHSRGLLSKGALARDGQASLDSLSFVRRPPSSPPSFGQGYSLPRGVSQPPLHLRQSSLPPTHETESRGGYEVDFVAQLDAKHKCPICLLALREPVQTTCGHRFCRSCIEQVLKKTRPQCPVDQEPLDKVFLDNFCKREVLSLCVRCLNAVAGCSWSGQLRELKGHLELCSFTLVLCPHWGRGCHHRMLKSNVQQHVEQDCEYRDGFCTHCRSTLSLKELEVHTMDVCPEVAMQCINNCGTMVKRKEIPQHIKHECEKTVLQCDFFAVGCKFHGNRSLMKDHVDVSQDHHLTLMMERNSLLDHQISKLNENVQERDEIVAHLYQQCERFEHRFCEMTTKLVEMEQPAGRYSQLEVRINAVEGLIDAGLATTQPTVTASSDAVASVTKKVDEARSMVTKAEAEASTVQRKITSVESKVSNIEHQIVHINTLIGRTDAILAEFDLRLLSQETTSFGGVLVWKIPDFNRHFEEARTGKKPSLYSPPFYTSRHGYKLCARVYLYGDGVGKNSHMSVFFVVMRGEFDALLAWPFHQKVTLTLLDQSMAKHHISDTFMPDPSSSSFQRPSSEMNIASGCPRFVSIDALRTANGYVKDNIIFLRIAIDCSGLPTY